MKTRLAVVNLLLFAIAMLAQTPSPEDRAALQKAEDTYTAGVLHKDIKLLDSVWADTFVDTDEQGGIATRQEQLAKVAASKTQIQSLNVDQERVDWYGDTAVVTRGSRLSTCWTANSTRRSVARPMYG
jgi:Domain of unknown function (DUF4440)